MTHPVSILLALLAVYALVGVLFAIAFVLRGAGAIDPVAKNAPARVRLLFVPGAIALWPLLGVLWARAGRAKESSS